MKKRYVYLLGLSILTSCSTVTKVTNSNANEMNTYESGVVMRPLLADVTVSDSRKSIDYIVPYYLSAKSEGKENALLQFKKTHKCDYVVDPIFEIITETGRKNETKIILNGYAATYSNIRQVDSLPKSVIQYNLLHKPVKALDYINTFEEKPPTMGIEGTILSYTGFQFDKIMGNSKNRFYISYESNSSDNRSISYDIVDNSSDEAMVSYNDGVDSYTTMSLGLMREYPITSWLKFRLQGGAHIALGKARPNYFNDFDFLNGDYFVNNYSGDEQSFGSFGLRIGGGLDFKVYKSLSLVAKMHYNLNLIKYSSMDETGSFYNTNSNMDVEDFKIKGVKFENDATLPLNLSVGLRFVF